jgi:hypothetical protein
LGLFEIAIDQGGLCSLGGEFVGIASELVVQLECGATNLYAFVVCHQSQIDLLFWPANSGLSAGRFQNFGVKSARPREGSLSRPPHLPVLPFVKCALTPRGANRP